MVTIDGWYNLNLNQSICRPVPGVANMRAPRSGGLAKNFGPGLNYLSGP